MISKNSVFSFILFVVSVAFIYLLIVNNRNANLASSLQYQSVIRKMELNDSLRRAEYLSKIEELNKKIDRNSSLILTKEKELRLLKLKEKTIKHIIDSLRNEQKYRIIHPDSLSRL